MTYLEYMIQDCKTRWADEPDEYIVTLAKLCCGADYLNREITCPEDVDKIREEKLQKNRKERLEERLIRNAKWRESGASRLDKPNPEYEEWANSIPDYYEGIYD